METAPEIETIIEPEQDAPVTYSIEKEEFYKAPPTEPSEKQLVEAREIEEVRTKAKAASQDHNELVKKIGGVNQEFGHIFVPKVEEEKPKKTSFWKKAVLWGGMTLGLAAANNADAQQKKVVDKEPVKTEKPAFVKTSEHGVSDNLKMQWNDYITWLETQGMRGNKSLNTGGMGNTMLEKFKDEQEKKGIHMILTPDSVASIQQELVAYKEQTERDIKAGKVIIVEKNDKGEEVKRAKQTVWDKVSTEKDENGHSVFVDNIAGEITTNTRFPENHVTYTKENRITMDTPKGKFEVATVVDKYTKTEGFAALRKE